MAEKADNNKGAWGGRGYGRGGPKGGPGGQPADGDGGGKRRRVGPDDADRTRAC